MKHNLLSMKHNLLSMKHNLLSMKHNLFSKKYNLLIIVFSFLHSYSIVISSTCYLFYFYSCYQK
jgi:hypothetical protein